VESVEERGVDERRRPDHRRRPHKHLSVKTA
jgi:hypothetical protein